MSIASLPKCRIIRLRIIKPEENIIIWKKNNYINMKEKKISPWCKTFLVSSISNSYINRSWFIWHRITHTTRYVVVYVWDTILSKNKMLVNQMSKIPFNNNKSKIRDEPIFHKHEHVQQIPHQLCIEQTKIQMQLSCFLPPCSEHCYCYR